MTAETPPVVGTVDTSLRDAADLAAKLAHGVADVAADEPGLRTEPGAVREVLRELQSVTSDLSLRLADAASRVEVLDAVARYRKRFDIETWPARSSGIADSLARDPMGGARDWLTAWLESVIAGRWDESDRLTAEPFSLPPETRWLPDRCAAAATALQMGSADRWIEFGEFLADGGELAGSTSIEGANLAASLLLDARVRAISGLADAAARVDEAAAISSADPCEVLAVRAMIERLAIDRTASSASMSAESSIWHPALAAGGNTCVASAVEAVHWATLGGSDADGILAEARQSIATVAAVVGIEGAINALIEAPPDEVWVAAAERLRSVGLFGDAASALARAAEPSDVTEAERARLSVVLAQDQAEAPSVIADLQEQSGLAAIRAGQTSEAITAYTAALELVPEHTKARLGLADALVVSVGSAPLAQARDTLTQAVALCTEAHAREYPDHETSWSLLVLSDAHLRLAGIASKEREASVWRGLLAAGRGVAFEPENGVYWSALALALMDLSCYRAADAVSRLAYVMDPDSEQVNERRLRSLLNAGKSKEGLALLDAIEERGTTIEKPWLLGMRALFEGEGDPDGALKHVQKALEIEPEALLWYHEVQSDMLALTGDGGGALEASTWVWRHAHLDEFDGLFSAARAALRQKLYDTARDLAEQAISLEGFDEGGGHAVRGLTKLAEGGDGWDDLRYAIRVAPTNWQLEDLHTFVRATASVIKLPDVKRLDQEFERARQDLAHTFEGLSPGQAAALEIGRALEHASGAGPGSDTHTAATLANALCLIADGDWDGAAVVRELGAARPELPELDGFADGADALATRFAIWLEDGADPFASDDIEDSVNIDVVLYLAESWYDELEGDTPQSSRMERRVEDAAAVAISRGTPPFIVQIGLDMNLEPDSYSISTNDGPPETGIVPSDRWYCPESWVAALGSAARASAVESRLSGDLVAIDIPTDVRSKVVAWSPEEVVARRVVEFHLRGTGDTAAPK